METYVISTKSTGGESIGRLLDTSVKSLKP